MEVEVQLAYEDLVAAIRQLPFDQLQRLKRDIFDREDQSSPAPEPTPHQQLLLTGPVMDDEQYNEYLNFSKNFAAWRIEQ